MCGGTSAVAPMPRQRMGLSPRVRGNLGMGSNPIRCRRSIPACAGEPQRASGRWRRTPVYPRVCGGTARVFCASLADVGLSPRVRGNPLGILRQRVPTWVYPRVCGGTPRVFCASLADVGLSPRVRGNPSGILRQPCRRGSIPACAGEPYVASVTGVYAEVYPRVCGGTSMFFPLYENRLGLSPRVRGNHFLRVGVGCRDGSIPACAGEPRCC